MKLVVQRVKKSNLKGQADLIKFSSDYLKDVNKSLKDFNITSQFRKIFDPGFTTKKRGWGLGLSLSQRIIEDYHTGKIIVKSSEVNKGTTFQIILDKVT